MADKIVKSSRISALRAGITSQKNIRPQSPITFRNALRELCGPNGERIWSGLFDIAEGKPWIPKLPDGREGPPQIPSTADRRAAYEYLANALCGRPVDQAAINLAESAAEENASVRALSGPELEREARRILARKVAELPQDAEIITEPSALPSEEPTPEFQNPEGAQETE